MARTKRERGWGAASIGTATAEGFDQLMARADHLAGPGSAVITHALYERWVERPRRNGRDPVWDSLWAEATAGAETAADGEAAA